MNSWTPLHDPRNPPAFPLPDDNVQIMQEGMTLRDYFAAAAITGKCGDGRVAEYTAQEAYEIADAMLAERGKP